MLARLRLASLAALVSLGALGSPGSHGPARAGAILDMPEAPHNAAQVGAFASRLVALRLVRLDADRLSGCERHCERLERVFGRVAAAAREQARRPVELRLVVVRDAATQAFSGPGGEIVVSERFVDAHGLTDAELAFVIAHEVMHVLLHHEAHAMALVAGVTAPGRTRPIADLYDDLEGDLRLVMKLAPAFHDHEFEADWQGLVLAALAGYDPREQAGFLRKLARAAPAGLQFTHPSASRRLERIDGTMPIAIRAHAMARAAGGS